MAVARSPIQTRSQAAVAEEEEQEAASSPTGQAALLRAMLAEMRAIREEQARMSAEHAAALDARDREIQERDTELQRLKLQLSRFHNFSCAGEEGRSGDVPARAGPSRGEIASPVGVRLAGACGAAAWVPAAGDVPARAGPSRGEIASPAGARSVVARESTAGIQAAGVGYKLKPDTFDGTGSFGEFFAQFELIARANSWDDSASTVALASSLRGAARGVLESVSSLAELSLEELRSRLELRFGEGLAQNYYLLFTNRRQKSGENFAALGSDIERLSRLAYAECAHAVRDKIACAQFIAGVSDRFVRRTLQLEGITSLSSAVQRATAIRVIHEESFEKRNEGGFNKFRREADVQGKAESGKDFKGKVGGKGFPARAGRRPEKECSSAGVECWSCGEVGHIRANCSKSGGNKI